MNARFQYYKLSNIYEDESYLKMVGENKPKYLYRYMEYSELSLKTLFDEKIWLSLPLYLNDPFEYEYGVYANGVLIGCFSEKYDSLVMWSHYSNRHQGYCLKYNFDDINSYFESNLYPVIYSPERFKPILTEKGNAMNIINAFTHKAYDWKYEKEWRIIRLLPVNKRRLTNIQINKGEYAKMPKPAEIIMGSRSCYDSDNIIAEYCKNNNILLSRMYMKGNKYRLYKKVLPFNLFDPPAVDLDKLMKEYLKTDAAKKDLKIIRKQNKVGEKQRYVSMKDFL